MREFSNARRKLRVPQRFADGSLIVQLCRRQIDSIERELEQLDELMQTRISQRANLVELFGECCSQAQLVTKLSDKLVRLDFARLLKVLEAKRCKLAERCLNKAAELLYLRNVGHIGEREPLERLWHSC